METQNRKIDSKTTKQIVIDKGWHKILKRLATTRRMSIKELVEDILSLTISLEELSK